MKKYIYLRLLKLLLSCFIFTIILFLLLKLAPGDPVQIILMRKGMLPDAELATQIREQWGLNQPLYQQYFNWITAMLQSDWGTSYLTDKPIIVELSTRYAVTLRLVGVSCFILFFIAIPTGFYLGLHEGSILDRLYYFLSSLLMGVPLYWGGLLLMIVFGVLLPFFPITYANHWSNYVLPIFALVIFESANLIRMIRSYVVQYKQESFVQSAYYRGIHPRYITGVYILRSILFPLLQLCVNSFIHILGAVIIIENIFGFPGIGKYLIETIYYRDFPAIQVISLFMALFSFSINCLVDILRKRNTLKLGYKEVKKRGVMSES